jgi:hypothetical protein
MVIAKNILFSPWKRFQSFNIQAKFQIEFQTNLSQNEAIKNCFSC